jgi:signal transduction histidine kinase
MNANQPDADVISFEKDYYEALSGHIAEASEASLMRGYELGRNALARGRSIPAVISIHREAQHALISGMDARRGVDGILDSAATFLAETLSPYEMTHRGYRDSLIAWRHINETLEEEIRRIAHALHDEAGQLLVSVHLQLARLAREIPIAELQVRDCQNLLNQVEQQLRHLSHELRPTVLDDLGWRAALEFLATSVSSRALVPVELRSSVTRRLPAPVEIALYRVVQEALTNAARHAAATCIRVEIDEDRGCVHGLISDDGVGFDVGAYIQHGGLGLRGMRERLGALGGSLHIVSTPGSGAQIRFQLPTGV